ncbi:MAG: hypothetical protein WC655_24835 [Candidatus Hydrogenedentales bacterium]|jgi:hypothetical protein
MKRVKQNKEKVADLQGKIASVCANLSHETPLYGTDTAKKIAEWAQSCDDLSQENIKLLVAIQRTNLSTPVAIEISGKSITKNIAEWVWRRREYANVDFQTWSKFTDRGLKEGHMQTSTGTPMPVTIIRHYDPVKRDEMIAMYRAEPHQIDAALEVVNATTELAA